ncbi:hypothetical protein G3I44_14060 [Halogeometricum borinquense]|uniref:Uncharacterized protein n=1 Tax=Halogeometricum borinquense TaxID=60847 RepID=A0A6C0ULS5_9EURY|nr:hypothetical protein [Halogeometricum borinquense]QIB75311.1 hypothetical protein G3I44_14060 [Halogeometricum borinquense]
MMYECPDGCGSTSFTQVVKQQETVTTDGAGSVAHVDTNGNPEVLELVCCDCGAEVEV